MRNPRIAVTFLGLGVCASLALTACDGDTNPSPTPASSSVTVNGESVFNFDLGDDAAVAGNSQIIFVGEVIKKTGTLQLGANPETQFDVRVITSIKGDRTGVITVNQSAGFNSLGEFFTVEGDELLKPGSVYLFAANYLASQGWYTALPVAWHEGADARAGNCSQAFGIQCARDRQRCGAMERRGE